MNIRYCSVGLLLVLGCSAGGGPEGPPSADGSGSNGSGGQQGVIPGSGGTDLVVPEDQFSDEDCDNVLPVVYRDFESTHPDFERADPGDEVRRGLVTTELGPGRKPVFLDSVGCAWEPTSPLACVEYNWVTTPSITSADTFDEWYRDVPGVNEAFPKEIVLDDVGGGRYVFASQEFFPLTIEEGGGESYRSETGVFENFHFTTEIHLQFTYAAQQQFSFFGDDDLWIFVNGKLALDLGGLHAEKEGTIDFDAQAAELGITPGNPYPMDIFHAERHAAGSHFRIETNISCFVPVEIY